MTVTSAVILAGGLGTRLQNTVPDRPKPMALVNGRPFLEYLLNYWMDQGISHFVISVGYRFDDVTRFFGTCYRGVKIDYAIEETPLGTGGGLLLAAEKVAKNNPFLLLNGDTFFAVDLKTLMTFSETKNSDWCFSLFRTHEKGRFMGIALSSWGQIVSLDASPGEKGQLANGGVYLVQPRALSSWKASLKNNISLESDIFPCAMTIGQRIFGLEFDRKFIDIGVPSDYYLAQTVLAE